MQTCDKDPADRLYEKRSEINPQEKNSTFIDMLNKKK
jgi:hypothetical protein